MSAPGGPKGESRHAQHAARLVNAAPAWLGCGAAALALSAAAFAMPAQAAAAAAPTTETAVLAGGCFWCVESDFDKLPGVLSTTSGYTGGTVADPTYEQVSAKHTGHAEAVKIVFDPAKLSYKALLDYYWHTIDPTTVDRQFCDVGSPYRTAIFAQNDAQLQQARASLAAIEKSKPFPQPIVTQVVMGGPFYAAEDYHQDYYRKNPYRYEFYRSSCGRDARLKQLWGKDAAAH